MGTLTEIDDYLRLLFAKVNDTYCRNCGIKIEPKNINQILSEIQSLYPDQRIYLLKESGKFKDANELSRFVKSNRAKVEKGEGFTRYLLVPQENKDLDAIEYFYLESPNIPEQYFPIASFGIFDRVTVNNKNEGRLREDMIKILEESKKF